MRLLPLLPLLAPRLPSHCKRVFDQPAKTACAVAIRAKTAGLIFSIFLLTTPILALLACTVEEAAERTDGTDRQPTATMEQPAEDATPDPGEDGPTPASLSVRPTATPITSQECQLIDDPPFGDHLSYGDMIEVTGEPSDFIANSRIAYKVSNRSPAVELYVEEIVLSHPGQFRWFNGLGMVWLDIFPRETKDMSVDMYPGEDIVRRASAGDRELSRRWQNLGQECELVLGIFLYADPGRDILLDREIIRVPLTPANLLPTATPPVPTAAPTEAPIPTAAPPAPTAAPTEVPTPTTAPPEPTPAPEPTATPRPTPTPTPAGKWSLEGGTPLHQAVFDGDLAKVEELLNQGADLDVGGAVVENDEDSVAWRDVSPLHLAAFNSDLAAAAMLLEWGADLERVVRVAANIDYDRYDLLLTPLFVAVMYNDDPELVALLLEWGANSEPDVLAIHMGTGYNVTLLGYGGTVRNVTPLYWALRHNPDPAVASLLLEGGASIDTLYEIEIPSWVGERRYTNFPVKPLHLAAAYNPDPEAVTLLLEWGADVNEWWVEQGVDSRNVSASLARGLAITAAGGGTFGVTPLQLAAAFNPNPEVTDTLLRRGAENDGFAELGGFDGRVFMESIREIVYSRGSISIESSAETVLSAAIRSPIHWALRYNSNLAVAELLLEPGTRLDYLDYQDYQGTPLHFAVRYGNLEITEALLDQGADAKATDSENNTPCQLARERGRFTGSPLLGRLCRP